LNKVVKIRPVIKLVYI